jgi:diguanylate cyclase (GGDEF)-like protein
VWIQDGDRVFELSGGRKSVAERSGALNGIPVTLVPEGPGRFWIGTSQGLAHYMPSLWQHPPGAPPLDDVVNGIAEDRAGRMWFLSAHSLLCLDGSQWSSFPLPKGESPWTVFTDGIAVMRDGRLVLNTSNSHLLVFDPVRRAFHVIRHPQNRRTHSFVQRSDGRLLVETYPEGSKHGGIFEVFDGSLFSPLTTRRQAWGDFELRALRIGSNDEIWVGGTLFFGVYRGPECQAINSLDGFADPGAYVIHLDGPGHALAGGRDGLFQWNGGKWQRIRSGLDRVRSISHSHDGTLWIASGTGVHRLRNGEWISNGVEDGLPSTVAYKVFEDSRRRIWAGTASGISLFHPDADVDPPQVQLTEAQNSREISPGGKMRITFTGIDKWKYTLPSRLLFSYRLDGGAWSPFATASFASFENLPAGSHRFEIRAMDRNGNISPVPAAHEFSVLRPWYTTPGFLWISAGAFTLIALLVMLAGTSYAHRGWLIQELSRKGKLERDRQAILQMIAGRDTLPVILQRIADLAAENCPGAACVVLRATQSGFDEFSEPSPPECVRAPIRALKSSDDWWKNLYAILSTYPAGRWIVSPVNSGDFRLGAVILFNGGGREILSDRAWLETFAHLAAAAIENAGLYERLEHQARHDALTGLPNRYSLENLLDASVDEAAANGNRLALLFLDLDRFKQVNDTLGHRVGDLFLKQVANRLSSVLVQGETLARIGGDEFTVLVDRAVDRQSVERLAVSLLAALRKPIRVEDHELFASASIGISFFPEDGDTPSALQKHADSAMYRAKASGRNQVKSFSAKMGSMIAEALVIERLLHRALDERLFELHYQPQFNLSGSVVCLEALLRLRNVDGQYVSPGRLIPVAEETGLIVPIGARVLRGACSQLREWLDEGLENTRIAVNVSAVQLARSSFASEVAETLAHFRIDPGLLELELTESAIMRNLSESKRQLLRLRKLGISIAIDDFGTGHSALSYLQTLPISVLKIDRSFVRRITRSSGLPMIKAILALASNLGMSVVAEGVETENQLEALRDCGCDLLQGYYLCRPQPPSRVRSLLDFRAVRPPVSEEEEYSVPVG